jgi:glyoxylase-like metal-dependent hydrolase (beta-lactamase superfamily II)
MQLAPHLHRVGNGLVNVYLVEDGGSVTVVDTGMAGMYGDLEPELAAMGRSKADIRGVVLTHGDTDHVGFAGRLHSELGVPVFVHEADAARARGEVKKPMTGWGPMKVGPLLGFMAYGLRKGGLGSPKVPELETVGGDATLDLPGAPRIIAMPGHTPGSVAVHVPLVGALFVGDAMTTRSVLTGEVGPRLAPFTLDVPAALAAMDRLDGIQAAWVLPGHGEPWTGGVAEALRQIRAAATPTPPAG